MSKKDPFAAYGGTAIEEDPFAAYGGTKLAESKSTAPLEQQHAWTPPDTGIRPPLSFTEHLHNIGRSIITGQQDDVASPEITSNIGKYINPANIGAVIGGITGGIPGAAVGASAGRTAENLAKAAGMGPEPPPSTAMGELQDVGMAGLKGGAGQAIAKIINTGVTTPFKPPAYPLPRPAIHPSVKDFTDAVGKTNNIHVEDTFRDTLNKAFPSLKEAEAKLNTKVGDIRDARVVAQTAAQDAWVPYRQLLDSTKRPIDRLDIIKTAGQNLPPSIPKTQARAAMNIVRQWSRDLSRTQYSASEIEDAAQALNAKLKAIYIKDGIDRAAAEKMPQYAGDEALLKAFRQLQDSTIKADTGYDAAPLRQNYGNIKAVHNALLKSPSEDDTLFDIFKRDIPISKSEVKGRVISRLTGSNPDQLVKRAFRNYTPPPSGTPGLVHAGWETPTTPETGDVAASYGAETRPVPVPKQLYSETATARQPFTMGPVPPEPPKQLGTGQKMLPAPGETSIKTPPQPPESFSEALKRQQTPQSRLMRETTGKGSFQSQGRPATAEEYLATKGGRQMPESMPTKPSSTGGRSNKPVEPPSPIKPTSKMPFTNRPIGVNYEGSSSSDVGSAADTIMKTVNRIERNPDSSVTFYRLHKEPEIASMPKEVFDKAILKLRDDRVLELLEHDHAQRLSEAARAEDHLVQDNKMHKYYLGSDYLPWYTSLVRR